MGVKVEEFLYDYFSTGQLKDALSNIGIPAGKTKKERVDKILEKWTAYNRDWYDLLDFLDWDDLASICDHFDIEYDDDEDEEDLMDKIEENEVLDFKNTKKKTQKNPSEIPYVNIGEQHITIGSNNKINSENKIDSDNATKINSDNTIISNLSDKQRKMIILGIITIVVMIGIAAYQSYESAIDNWHNSESSKTITTKVIGDENTVIVGDNNTVIGSGGKYAELDPSLANIIQEFVQDTIAEQQQRINELQEKLLTTTDENEHYKLERIIDKLQLATYALENKNFADAEKQYRLILETDEKNSDALEGMGLVFARQDKYEESIFYYDLLLETIPDNYEALVNNAWSYALLKNYEKSLEILNSLEYQEPNDVIVLSHKCWVLHKLDLHNDAVETCKKVLAHGTDDSRVPMAYSLSLSLLNRSEEALQTYEKLYSEYPDDFSTIINYGTALFDVGQIEKSLEIYNDGLEKFPNQKALVHNKNVLCADNPQLQC